LPFWQVNFEFWFFLSDMVNYGSVSSDLAFKLVLRTEILFTAFVKIK